MNNHEWNPIATAPKGKPILATDDESVWFGRVSAAAAIFDGANLQDGSSIIWMDLDDLTGWLPAPATMWEPQKTADEQFRELGYEKKRTAPGSRNGIVYLHESGVIDLEISQGVCTETYYDPDFGEKIVGLEFKEVLACAQLIREMEAEENG